jgi:hypothetical protein
VAAARARDRADPRPAVSLTVPTLRSATRRAASAMQPSQMKVKSSPISTSTLDRGLPQKEHRFWSHGPACRYSSMISTKTHSKPYSERALHRARRAPRDRAHIPIQPVGRPGARPAQIPADPERRISARLCGAIPLTVRHANSPPPRKVRTGDVRGKGRDLSPANQRALRQLAEAPLTRPRSPSLLRAPGQSRRSEPANGLLGPREEASRRAGLRPTGAQQHASADQS